MSNETSRDGEPGRDVNPETVLSVCRGGGGGGGGGGGLDWKEKNYNDSSHKWEAGVGGGRLLLYIPEGGPSLKTGYCLGSQHWCLSPTPLGEALSTKLNLQVTLDYHLGNRAYALLLTTSLLYTLFPGTDCHFPPIPKSLPLFVVSIQMPLLCDAQL